MFALAAWASGLAGCSHVPRQAAADLSRAGLRATGALADDVDARVSRLEGDRAAQDFVATYAIMRTCKVITHGHGADPNCDTVALAEARSKSEVTAQIGKLADTLILRSRALDALGRAYAALGDEAAYDAPGALDAAINPALDAVNQFGSAVGLGPLPSLASEGIKAVGNALAARAQTRRLLRGSRRIALITEHMRLALVKERVTFALLDSLLANLDRQTRDAILKAGILDSSMVLRQIAGGTGMHLDAARLDAAMASDQALSGAAEVATLDTLRPQSMGDLDAGINLLADLGRQHARFEQGAPLSIEDITADVDRLAALARALKR